MALLTLGGGSLTAGSGTGALTLQTGGVNGDGGTIRAGTLSGTFSGPVSLGNPGNAVPTILGLQTIGAGNGLTFVDGVGLTVAGPVSSSGQIALTVLGNGNNLVQDSTVTAASDVEPDGPGRVAPATG